MNPTLRKLSKPGLRALEIARLLQRHIGEGTNVAHCESAISALKRIHDDDTNKVTQVVARMLSSDGDACVIIKEVIDLLQSDVL